MSSLAQESAAESLEEDKGELYGAMGYFDKPADLYHACEELRDAGYKDFDAQTPFPVHGLEKAMGLKPTKLPWFVLMGGFSGFFGAIALTWYCNWDYPLNISGKYAFSYQIYIPIYFELTILLTALTCFFGLWIICKLPMFFHPTMTHKAFPKTTDDGFFLCIEATDPKYDSTKTVALLEKLGAKEVAEVFS
jgi:hypothetical protein